MADRALSPTRERGEERTAVSGKVAREELKKFGEALSLLVESAKEVHRAQCTPSRPRHQFRLMRAHSDDGRREARVGAGGLWRASRSRGLRDRPPVCPGGGRHAASRRLQAHLCTHRSAPHRRPLTAHSNSILRWASSRRSRSSCAPNSRPLECVPLSMFIALSLRRCRDAGGGEASDEGA